MKPRSRQARTRFLRGSSARFILRVVAIAFLLGIALDALHPAEAKRRRRARYVSTPAEREASKRVRAAARDSTAPFVRFHGSASHDTSLVSLAHTLSELSARAGGPVGFAVLHIESGVGVSLRGNERFPMASVYKIPVALQVLHRVACDSLSMEDSVRIVPSDFRTGSGWIWARRRRVRALAVRDLLDAMLVDSDNTASDLLMRIGGGPAAVTGRLRAIGVREVRVDRYEAQMSLDYSGVSDAPPDTAWTVGALWELKKDVPLDRRAESASAFLADPRDTSTPDAMADLLVRIWRLEALGADETSRLLEIMERCRTGTQRIPGLLPAGTPVAHKTGTWSTAFGVTAAVNDVGIVTLPERRGHLAMAVFVRGSQYGPRRIERTIARMASSAYTHWAGPVQASGNPDVEAQRRKGAQQQRKADMPDDRAGAPVAGAEEAMVRPSAKTIPTVEEAAPILKLPETPADSSPPPVEDPAFPLPADSTPPATQPDTVPSATPPETRATPPDSSASRSVPPRNAGASSHR